jgi:hypothetical protein
MTLDTIAPLNDDPLMSLPAAAYGSSGPAPSITVTIIASYTTQRDSIVDWHNALFVGKLSHKD